MAWRAVSHNAQARFGVSQGHKHYKNVSPSCRCDYAHVAAASIIHLVDGEHHRHLFDLLCAAV